MSEKELWLTVRRALLMVCKAIEVKYMGTAIEYNPPPEATTITEQVDTHKII